jgi:hypothetical protein
MGTAIPQLTYRRRVNLIADDDRNILRENMTSSIAYARSVWYFMIASPAQFPIQRIGNTNLIVLSHLRVNRKQNCVILREFGLTQIVP